MTRREAVALVIEVIDGGVTWPCALCRQEVDAGPGPALVRSDTREAVCAACGRQHAPVLVFLLDEWARDGRARFEALETQHGAADGHVEEPVEDGLLF